MYTHTGERNRIGLRKGMKYRELKRGEAPVGVGRKVLEAQLMRAGWVGNKTKVKRGGGTLGG
jgi:hypothetical protein